MKHNFEDNIICPYCDYEDEDSWEFEEDDGVVTCGSCEKEFNVSRDVKISYSTSKIECSGNHNYEFDHYFKKTRNYIKKDWVNLPESEWKYFKINVCSICDDKQFEEITKEDYKS